MKTEAMNRVLHPERVAGRWKHRYKPTFTTTGGLIPDGVISTRARRSDGVAEVEGPVWVWFREGFGMAPGWIRDRPSKS